MAYTVSYKHPHFADDTEFGVAGLGTIPNGGSIEVDAELERNFIAIRGMTLEDAFADDSMIEVSGSSELSADEVKQLVPEPAPTDTEPEAQASTPFLFDNNNDNEDGEQ